MINDFIEWALSIIDQIYSLIPENLNLINKITALLSSLQSYRDTWNSLMSVIYFVIGKPLLTTCIGVGVVIIVIKLVFAIINIVGQYVP